MVRQDEPKMGQGGMCGVTMPGTDSLPQMPESAGSSANGIAVEMQVRSQSGIKVLFLSAFIANISAAVPESAVGCSLALLYS